MISGAMARIAAMAVMAMGRMRLTAAAKMRSRAVVGPGVSASVGSRTSEHKNTPASTTEPAIMARPIIEAMFN